MVYKCIEFGDKTFASKEAMFDALLENMGAIIQLKKAAVQKSYNKGQIGAFNLPKADATKAGFELKENYFYPVINSTNYLDSHGDVHFPGIWDRSLKANKGELLYVMDHELKIKDVIAWPNDVNAFVKTVPWSFVGKNYAGETQALIYEISKDAIVSNEARSIIENKKPVQNSVRMQYVKMQLAVNDTRKEFKEQKDYFDSRIEQIANKEAALEAGYFWGQEESKIVKEGSMVLFGSNDATNIQYLEPGLTTSETADPLKGTLQPSKSIYSLFI